MYCCPEETACIGQSLPLSGDGSARLREKDALVQGTRVVISVSLVRLLLRSIVAEHPYATPELLFVDLVGTYNRVII